MTKGIWKFTQKQIWDKYFQYGKLNIVFGNPISISDSILQFKQNLNKKAKHLFVLMMLKPNRITGKYTEWINKKQYEYRIYELYVLKVLYKNINEQNKIIFYIFLKRHMHDFKFCFIDSLTISFFFNL